MKARPALGPRLLCRQAGVQGPMARISCPRDATLMTSPHIHANLPPRAPHAARR